MYALRFPLRIWHKLQPVFEQLGLTSQIDTTGGCVVAKVNAEQATLLKLDPVFKRIGPIGGWDQSRDKDGPSTPPPGEFDFT